jgi:hypothetical protein
MNKNLHLSKMFKAPAHKFQEQDMGEYFDEL